jgi:hypothetical protein
MAAGPSHWDMLTVALFYGAFDLEVALATAAFERLIITNDQRAAS